MPSAKTLIVFAGAFAISASAGAYIAQNSLNTNELNNKPSKNIEKLAPLGKVEIVPGEIVVKLKSPLSEMSQANEVPNNNPAQKGKIQQFDRLNRTKLPKKLVEIHEKYQISGVERVFPYTEAHSKDLDASRAGVSSASLKSIDEGKRLLANMERIYKLTFSGKVSVEQITKELAADPSVEFAEPNYIVDLNLTPNDPYFPLTWEAFNQWGLENHGRPGSAIFRTDSDIDVLEAWNIQRGTSSTIIAVIDSGIDYTHPDLGGGIGSTKKVIGGYDFVDDDTNPMDDYGHGTHVAGIIAASGNNKAGVIGVCPECKLMAVKIFTADGRGTTLRSADAVYYAANNGAKIINASWGTTANSEAVRAAVEYAVSKNITVIASAGNHGNSTKFYPAALPNVISVASTDYKDIKAASSAYDDGSGWVDVSAPGTFILSTALTNGKTCVTAHETKVARYGYCSGTSMAAPMVAGIAGLILSKNPTWTYSQISNQIKSTTDNINSYNPSYVNKLGTGRVNAHKALTVSQTWCADSDWGLNYKTKGSYKGNGLGCPTTPPENFDQCYPYAPYTNVINETHCGPQGQCWVSAYTCPNGCSNGRCL